MPMDENALRSHMQRGNIEFSRFIISAVRSVWPCRQRMPEVQKPGQTICSGQNKSRKNLCFAQISKGFPGIYFTDLRLQRIKARHEHPVLIPGKFGSFRRGTRP